MPAVHPIAKSTASPNAGAAPSRALRALMSKNVGVVRTGAGLARALATITDLDRQAPSPESQNIAVAALLIAAAAYQRRESRGAHFRQDFPASDPAQAHRTMMTLAQARHIAEQAPTAEPLTAEAL
jgi:L-aspartate oxidase